MNACETTPHSPGKRLAPNHHSTENVEEAYFQTASLLNLSVSASLVASRAVTTARPLEYNIGQSLRKSQSSVWFETFAVELFVR